MFSANTTSSSVEVEAFYEWDENNTFLAKITQGLYNSDFCQSILTHRGFEPIVKLNILSQEDNLPSAIRIIDDSQYNLTKYN